MAQVDTDGCPLTASESTFDHLDPAFEADPFPVFDALRASCPVARSENYDGFWLLTRYDDVEQVIHDSDRFSANVVMVPRDLLVGFDGGPFSAPPLTSDPPFHSKFRRMLLPVFTRHQIRKWEAATRACAIATAEKLAGRPTFDAAMEYAQDIPVSVIARMMGVAESDKDTFTDWIHRLFIVGPSDIDGAAVAMIEMYQYLYEQIEIRRESPTDDLINLLMTTEVDGERLDDNDLLGSLVILLLAGIDTTWSAIGSSLHYLATHTEDRQRLLAAMDEPVPQDPADDIWYTACEEFLRAFSPVTIGREVKEDVRLRDRVLAKDDLVLVSYPAANRDPEVFERPNEVVIDRKDNRHMAFGVGIHRCLGSNLARMELRIALQEFLRRIPNFHLDPDRDVLFGGGQVRGARQVPLIREARGRPVKVTVDPDKCHGHQVCAMAMPELFDADDLGFALVLNDGEVPAGQEAQARRAASNCPEKAITVEER